jgi:hypothetical protein
MIPGELNYDAESDRVVLVLRTPERTITYDPARKTVSELTASGEWVDFPVHRDDPEAGS